MQIRYTLWFVMLGVVLLALVGCSSGSGGSSGSNYGTMTFETDVFQVTRKATFTANENVALNIISVIGEFQKQGESQTVSAFFFRSIFDDTLWELGLHQDSALFQNSMQGAYLMSVKVMTSGGDPVILGTYNVTLNITSSGPPEPPW